VVEMRLALLGLRDEVEQLEDDWKLTASAPLKIIFKYWPWQRGFVGLPKLDREIEFRRRREGDIFLGK
jgi:hypothetical protein